MPVQASSSRYATILRFPGAVNEETMPYDASSAAEAAPARGQAGPPVELDAFELHRRMVAFQRVSDRARLGFLQLLAIFDEGRRYLELGYSSSKHYLVQEFNLGRGNGLELIRVARRLGELPRLAAALGDSQIRWSTLRAVSRVATSATEAEWLEFATTHTLEQTEHEVQRAIAERRDRPADGSDYGLSNILTRIAFDLTLEEKERVMTAMARVAEAMGAGAPTDLASVVLFLSQRILEGARLDGAATVNSVDAASVGSGSRPRPTSGSQAPGLTVVYHRYGEHRATVDTPDGPVRVDAEVVDRIADVAEPVALTEEDVAEAEPLADGAVDRPNSSTLARKVRRRDGERCANPGCGSRESLQAHHIRHRADGGRTVLSNETAICRTCHTLVHAGLLAIEVGSEGRLRWIPRARTPSLAPSFDPLPDLTELLADIPSPGPVGSAASVDVDALVDGLTSLGIGPRAARRRLDAALAKLGPGASDESVVLREALRLGA